MRRYVEDDLSVILVFEVDHSVRMSPAEIGLLSELISPAKKSWDQIRIVKNQICLGAKSFHVFRGPYYDDIISTAILSNAIKVYSLDDAVTSLPGIVPAAAVVAIRCDDPGQVVPRLTDEAIRLSQDMLAGRVLDALTGGDDEN